ncbi:MAG: tetratricopeptide repeat protein [Imperialibacter sp.]|uniref:tetratricopeptide repeat protein n=1 Tax=Imperialibacter sp. TaxID=2038411 RepID=UPI0032ED9CE0
MKSIYEFKKETDNLPSTDLLKQVEYYRNNSTEIFMIDESIDQEHYRAKMKLMGDYGMTLSANSNYSEAYPILTKAISLWRTDPYRDETPPEDISYFQHLLLHLGVAAFHKKDIKEARETFRLLVKKDPTNYKYQNWQITVSLYRLNIISRISGYVFLALIVLRMLLKSILPEWLDSFYYPVSATFVLAYFTIEIVKWRTRSKLEKGRATSAQEG